MNSITISHSVLLTGIFTVLLLFSACTGQNHPMQTEDSTAKQPYQRQKKYCFINTPPGGRGPLISPKRVDDCSAYSGYFVAYSVDAARAEQFLDDWAHQGRRRISTFAKKNKWPGLATGIKNGCGPIAISSGPNSENGLFETSFVCEGNIYAVLLRQDNFRPVTMSVAANESEP